MPVKRAFLLAISLVASLSTHLASAQECGSSVSRDDVARCAVRASLAVRAERQTGEAIEGRRVAASPLLPSNPVVALTGARRDIEGASATNWSATLSQELEIAGQRGARRRAAELEGEAQGARVEAARRDAAAIAWVAYFDALAANAEVELTKRLASNAAQIAGVARGMADRGLLAPVDADVADAGRVNVDQAALAAERRARGAQLALANALGLEPGQVVTTSGDLVPLRGVEEEARAALGTDGRDRPEVKALDAERRAQEARASAFARSRVPNPTVSIFAQSDGFNERVLGVGLALPIPLPQPVGRTLAGEIAEANALASRAGTDAERARREAKAQLLAALADYDVRKRGRDVFTDERVTRAADDVDTIAKEIQAGRLAVRDALVSQQALVGLLRASLEARLALCVASVELGRAAGIQLDRSGR